MTITTRRRQLAAVLALLAVSSTPAAAIELEDGKLSLNGFGSWAYGASDRNDFLVARHTGHFDSGDFALALTSRLSDRAVAGAQLRYAPSTAVSFSTGPSVNGDSRTPSESAPEW
jgi:hypothetical protein